MLQHEIDSSVGVITVTPSGELAAEDFRALTDVIDEYSATEGPLRRVLIQAEDFPGWDSFGALFQHLKFIREQRDRVEKVAAVTDSGFLTIMPHFIDHFVRAEVRHFPYEEKDAAWEWLIS